MRHSRVPFPLPRAEDTGDDHWWARKQPSSDMMSARALALDFLDPSLWEIHISALYRQSVLGEFHYRSPNGHSTFLLSWSYWNHFTVPLNSPWLLFVFFDLKHRCTGYWLQVPFRLQPVSYPITEVTYCTQNSDSASETGHLIHLVHL